MDVICIVYPTKGCWSTNHTKDKRPAALRKNSQARHFLADIASTNHTENDIRADDQQEKNQKQFINRLEEISDSAIYTVYIDHEPKLEMKLSSWTLAGIKDNYNTSEYISYTRHVAASRALTQRVLQLTHEIMTNVYGAIIDMGLHTLVAADYSNIGHFVVMLIDLRT